MDDTLREVNRWIVRKKIRPSAYQRLFCFPYAGVGTAVFQRWSDSLGPDIEVCSIQLPGREQRLRERPFTYLIEIIPSVVSAIGDLLDRPYAFYGHSMGAKIAFETARALVNTDARQPSHLFVGASPAPQLPLRHPLIAHLEQQEFLHAIQQRYGGIPKQVLEEEELLTLLIPALRADITMIETYRYEPGEALNCPITAIGGVADRIISKEEIARWEEQTRNTFVLHMLRGDHFFLNSDAPKLLQLIAGALAAPEYIRPVLVN